MIPQIFWLGPLPINSFGLMVALAILVGIYRLQHSFKLNGLNPALAEGFVLAAGISGLIGARLWFIIENYTELKYDLLGALFSSAGFTFYGGLIVAWSVLYFLCRRHSIANHKFFDSVGPTMAIAYAIGRLGCQLSGDGDYGIATSSWLGMSYSSGVVPTEPGVLVFPTPLYESSCAALIAVVLSRVEPLKNWFRPYKRFGLYLLLISTERFFVEFIRVNPELLWGFSEAQLVALLLIILGSIMVSGVFSSNQPQQT